MKNKLSKVEVNLEFSTKRNTKLTTPCCNKSNKDGKFANYKHFAEIYGYCHSCGKATLPPSLYVDDKGKEYIWNDIKKCFEENVLHSYYKNVTQLSYKDVIQCNTNDVIQPKTIKYIPNELINRFCNHKPESHLLQYLRNTYGNKKVDLIKKMYYIGTSKDGGTVFWNINQKQKVQKAKVSYYNTDGRRTTHFKVPYKNEEGYYSCLFGEHLIEKTKNIDKQIILVESEKTALVCAIHLPNYIWLSYSGINGLTENKLDVLIGHKVLLVPDMSENAVTIMNNKIPHLKELGIDAHIWNMTNGKSDEQLKLEGWYNCDLEDVFRDFAKN